MKKPFRAICFFWAFILIFGYCTFFDSNTFAKVPSQKQSELVENEPIDVVMTYVDLTDSKLQRSRRSRIEKDEENGEIRYSVRSILQNMPWVRKVFIVTPNDKVKYFKDPEFTSDKIAYINDYDVLGFKSISSITYEFNFWRLKDMGVSENFIYMNDDWFIGKPMKKSDFFYELNGRVVPYVNSGRVEKDQKSNIESVYRERIKHKTKDLKQTGTDYEIQVYATYLFLYKMLGNNISILRHTHNAIAENMSDLKELYDFVDKNYKYADACLRAYKREYESFQHQVLYSCYFYNKHHRKLKKIPYNYFDLYNAASAKLGVPMFCINTSGGVNYTQGDYVRGKIAMHTCFPKATPYEIPLLRRGAYIIESSLKKGMVVDVAEAAPGDGVNIRLWERNNTDAQKFNVIPQSDGTYVLEPLCSGKRVDVCSGSSEPGTNICQYSKNGTDAQKWYLVPSNTGYFYIVSKCNKMCMDVDEARTSNGTNIKCWYPNGNNAQKFKLIKV